jgi:hypothetical protein
VYSGRRLDIVGSSRGSSTTLNGRLNQRQTHDLLTQVIFGIRWDMERMAVEIGLMVGWWCWPIVWSSWTSLWLSGAGLHDGGRRMRHRKLCTLLLRFTGSGLLDTHVIMCLYPSSVATLYFPTELTLSSDL